MDINLISNHLKMIQVIFFNTNEPNSDSSF